LRIQIQIRLRIQGFDGKKIEKILQLKKCLFFKSKIAIHLSSGLHKARPSNKRSLKPSKKIENPALENITFLWVFFALQIPNT
jgi:hypothetical protein